MSPLSFDYKVHLVVYGVGAVGGFYGGELAIWLGKETPSNIRLSFVARGQTYEVLKNHGLSLQTSTEEILIEKPNVYPSYLGLEIKAEEKTIVLLCVKSKDTAEAAQNIKNNFSTETFVVSVQNGIKNEDRLCEALGPHHVIGCLTNIAAEVISPGVYLKKGSYTLIIGELNNSNETWDGKTRIKVIEEILLGAGINVKISEKIKQDQWSKLVWNTAFNPLSVVHEANVGQLLANPESRKTIQEVMREVKLIAAAEGYPLAPDVDQKHIERTDVPEWFDFKTSMLQDYQRGKELETYDLLGIIVELGAKYQIPTPYSQQVLKELESKLTRC